MLLLCVIIIIFRLLCSCIITSQAVRKLVNRRKNEQKKSIKKATTQHKVPCMSWAGYINNMFGCRKNRHTVSAERTPTDHSKFKKKWNKKGTFVLRYIKWNIKIWHWLLLTIKTKSFRFEQRENIQMKKTTTYKRFSNDITPRNGEKNYNWMKSSYAKRDEHKHFLLLLWVEKRSVDHFVNCLLFVGLFVCCWVVNLLRYT